MIRSGGRTVARAAAAIGLGGSLWVLIGCAAADPQPAPDGAERGAAWFEEVAIRSGIEFHHRSGHDGRYLFPEIIGGGAALFDMDGDGDLDAYLVQSGDLRGAGPASSRLFRNDGQGRFTDITAGSGVAVGPYGMGVAAADYDNDGDIDLYVTHVGPNVLLRNEGGGRFVDVAAAAGVADAGWGTSAAFLDYDADGDLDLFVVNYVNWSPSIEQDCYNPSGLLDYCLPTNYHAPAVDRLFRNEGDGTFRDVTAEAGFQTSFGNGLGVVADDFDGDSRIDIFVANDTMMNQLWINRGDGTFADESLLRGCALDEHGMAKAGMGVEASDLDDDGDIDLLVVNLQGQTDSYFRNDGGFFSDQTGAIGLGSASRSFTRFGVGFADFDNDGRLDLYQANGRVVQSPEPAAADPYAEPNLLFRGTHAGRMELVEPRGGTIEPLAYTSRAAAFGDVDGDGGIDVLIVNRDGPAQLLRNVVPNRGNWVALRVVERSGRDALGARVSFDLNGRRITRTVRSAYSYAAASDPRVHVGLGEAATLGEVDVTWVDGSRETFAGVAAGATVELRRGSGF